MDHLFTVEAHLLMKAANGQEAIRKVEAVLEPIADPHMLPQADATPVGNPIFLNGDMLLEVD